MRSALLLLPLIVVLVTPVTGQDPEEITFLIGRAQKTIFAPKAEMAAWRGGVETLVYIETKKGERPGWPILFKALPDLKKQYPDRHEYALWLFALNERAGEKVPIKNIPDFMIPDLVELFEKSKTKNDKIIQFMDLMTRLGPRAKASLPTLRWIRDEHSVDDTVLLALRAIKAIEGKK
jgi:hypothetical protein